MGQLSLPAIAIRGVRHSRRKATRLKPLPDCWESYCENIDARMLTAKGAEAGLKPHGSRIHDDHRTENRRRELCLVAAKQAATIMASARRQHSQTKRARVSGALGGADEKSIASSIPQKACAADGQASLLGSTLKTASISAAVPRC